MNMGKVLGLAGKKYSGKSTAAEGLPSGWVQVGFADSLKRMLVDHCILTDEQAWGDAKKDPIDWLDGVTPRRVMQVWGTEAGRSIHPDIWVKLWKREAEEYLGMGYSIVTADVRFPNEIKAIRALGGLVLWVDRPGLDDGDPHESENAISATDCDAVLTNYDGPALLQHTLRGMVA